jgi:hypothetical protein
MGDTMTDTRTITVTSLGKPVTLVVSYDSWGGRPATRWDPEEYAGTELYHVAHASDIKGRHTAQAVKAASVAHLLSEEETQEIEELLEAELTADAEGDYDPPEPDYDDTSALDRIAP